MKNLKVITSIFMALSMMFIMSVSQATIFSFENITNNSSIQLSDQLSVDVTDGGSSEAGNLVAFKFYNNVGIASSITDVYFDNGATNLFTEFSIFEVTTGVSFDLNPSPKNLPAGETIDFYSDFGGDSTAPTSANGVDAADEYIIFLGLLDSAFSYDDAIAALFDGGFRVGMHLQAIAGGGVNDSDSYATVNPVPVPAAAWLFGTVLFGFFATSRRKKNS